MFVVIFNIISLRNNKNIYREKACGFILPRPGRIILKECVSILAGSLPFLYVYCKAIHYSKTLQKRPLLTESGSRLIFRTPCLQAERNPDEPMPEGKVSSG